MKDLRALMNDVASDTALKARFRGATRREDCVDMLVDYAQTKGYALSASEVNTMVGGGVSRRLSASELAGVVGGKRCYWFDDSSGCSYGSCSQFSFY